MIESDVSAGGEGGRFPAAIGFANAVKIAGKYTAPFGQYTALQSRAPEVIADASAELSRRVPSDRFHKQSRRTPRVSQKERRKTECTRPSASGTLRLPARAGHCRRLGSCAGNRARGAQPRFSSRYDLTVTLWRRLSCHSPDRRSIAASTFPRS